MEGELKNYLKKKKTHNFNDNKIFINNLYVFFFFFKHKFAPS